MAINRKANRKYPSLPVVAGDLASHTDVLTAVKAAMEIGQRRTNDFPSSFVQVRDLIDLGMVDAEGNLNDDFGGGGGGGDSDLEVPEDTVRGRNDSGTGPLENLTMEELRIMLNLGKFSEVRGASFVGFGSPIVVPANNVALTIKEDCTIEKVVVLTMGGTGSCVIDIWKEEYADYPATSSDSICPSNKPTISSGIKYKDETLTGWNTALSEDDTLIFNLQSNSTFTAVFVFLVLKAVGSTAADGYTDERVRDIVLDELDDVDFSLYINTSVPAVPDTIPLRDADAYVYSATPPAADSSEKCATTEWVNSASSLGANGYRTHPDGLIEQWGYDARLGSATQTVTFPIAFPNACFNVQLTCLDSGGSSGQVSTVESAVSGSDTSFGLNHADAITGTYWRALGN